MQEKGVCIVKGKDGESEFRSFAYTSTTKVVFINKRGLPFINYHKYRPLQKASRLRRGKEIKSHIHSK